jgi:hypothetical protein
MMAKNSTTSFKEKKRKGHGRKQKKGPKKSAPLFRTFGESEQLMGDLPLNQ